MAGLGLTVGLPVALLLLAGILGLVIFAYCRWRRLNKDKIKQEKPGADEEAGTGSDPRADAETGKILPRNKPEILLRAPSHSGAEVYVVRHFYQAEDPSQLTLHTGRLVEVLEKQDTGWWRGCIDDTYEGWFPANFVTKIEGYENEGYLEEDEELSNREPPKKPGTKSPAMVSKRQLEPYQKSSILQEEEAVEGDGADSIQVAPGSLDYQNVLIKGRKAKAANVDAGNTSSEKGFKSQAMSPVIETTKDKNQEMKKEDDNNEDDDDDGNNRMVITETSVWETEPESVYEEVAAPRFNAEKKDTTDKTDTTLSEPEEDSGIRKHLMEYILSEESLQVSQPISGDAATEGLTDAATKGLTSLTDEDVTKEESPSTRSPTLQEKTMNKEYEDVLVNEYAEIGQHSFLIATKTDKDQVSASTVDATTKEHLIGKVQRESELLTLSDSTNSPNAAEAVYANIGELDRTVKGDSSADVTVEKPERSLLTTPKARANHKEKSKSLPAKMILGGDFGETNTDIATSNGHQKTHVAMYPFFATSEGHLSFDRNDVLIHLEEDDNGQIRGRHRETGKEGWFPKHLVREGKSPGFQQTPNSPGDSHDDMDSEGEFTDDDITGIEYKALYAYASKEEGDLSFSAGDQIVVLEKLESGWWRGCISDREGWFPGSYVESHQVPVNSDQSSIPTTPDSGFTSFHQAEPLASSSPLTASSPEMTAGSSSSPNSSMTGLSISQDRRRDSSQSKAGQASTWKSDFGKKFTMPKLVKISKKKLKKTNSSNKENRPAPPAPPIAIEVVRPSSLPAEVVVLPSSSQETHQRNSQGSGQTGRRRSSNVQRPNVPPPAPPPNRNSNDQSSADGSKEYSHFEQPVSTPAESGPIELVPANRVSLDGEKENTAEEDHIYQNHIMCHRNSADAIVVDRRYLDNGQTLQEDEEKTDEKTEGTTLILGVSGESSTDGIFCEDTELKSNLFEEDSDLLSSILGTLGQRDIHIKHSPETNKSSRDTEYNSPAISKGTRVLKVKPVPQAGNSPVPFAGDHSKTKASTTFSENTVLPQKPPRSPRKKSHDPTRPVVAVKPVSKDAEIVTVSAETSDEFTKEQDLNSNKTVSQRYLQQISQPVAKAVTVEEPVSISQDTNKVIPQELANKDTVNVTETRAFWDKLASETNPSNVSRPSMVKDKNPPQEHVPGMTSTPAQDYVVKKSPQSKPDLPPKPDIEVIKAKRSKSVSDLAADHNLSVARSPDGEDADESVEKGQIGPYTRSPRPTKVPPKRPKRPSRRARSAGALVTDDMAKELGLSGKETTGPYPSIPPKPAKRVKRVSSLMQAKANEPVKNVDTSKPVVKHVVSPTTKTSLNTDPQQFHSRYNVNQASGDLVSHLSVETTSASSVTSAYSPSSITSPTSPSLRFYTPQGFSPKSYWTEDTPSESVITETSSFDSTSIFSTTSTIESGDDAASPASSKKIPPVKPPRSKNQIADFATPRPYKPPAIKMGTRHLSSALSNNSPTSETWPSPSSSPLLTRTPLPGSPGISGSPGSTKRSRIRTQLSDLRSSQESLNISDSDDLTPTKEKGSSSEPSGAVTPDAVADGYGEDALVDEINLAEAISLVPAWDIDVVEKQQILESSGRFQTIQGMGELTTSSPVFDNVTEENLGTSSHIVAKTVETGSEDNAMHEYEPVTEEKTGDASIAEILESLPDGPPPPVPMSPPPEFDEEEDGFHFSTRTPIQPKSSHYELTTVRKSADLQNRGIVTDLGQVSSVSTC